MSESLSSEDKKIILKVKKLLGARDYAQIDAGIELLRSLNQANLYEALLNECSITESGEFSRNKFFTGSGPAQPYLDYIMLCLIAYAPKDAKVHESLKVSNVKNLILETNHEAITNSYLPLENFKNLRKLIIDGNGNIDNIDFLNELKKLKKIEIRSCDKLQNLDGLINCVNLETIVIDSCNQIQNLNGLINCIKLKEIMIKSCRKLPRAKSIAKLKSLQNNFN